MKVLSLRDLMLCEELSHIPNEVTLIHPSNDKLVASLIEQLGYNINKAWHYEPSFHRDMQNKTQVGFMLVGEYNTDPKYRHLMDMTDRLVIAGMVDPSLAKEMLEIQGKRFNYKNDDEIDFKSRQKPNDPRYYSEDELLEMGYSMGEVEDEYDSVEDNCDAVTSQINALLAVRFDLRGE